MLCHMVLVGVQTLSLGRKTQHAQLGKYVHAEHRSLSRLLVLMPFYSSPRFPISKAVL